MNLVVAVDNQWGIGFQDRLLFRISEDMKHFRALTIGKVVVLGRKTLQTFPGSRPLEHRVNIVMSRQKLFKADSAIISSGLCELAEILKEWPDDDVYVIGGSSIYDLLVPYCSNAYVTKIMADGRADCYFPNLDQLPQWRLVGSEAYHSTKAINLESGDLFEVDYEFCHYQQKNPMKIGPSVREEK